MSSIYTIRYMGFRCSRQTDDRGTNKDEIYINMAVGGVGISKPPSHQTREHGAVTHGYWGDTDQSTVLWSGKLPDAISLLVHVIEKDGSGAKQAITKIVDVASKVGEKLAEGSPVGKGFEYLGYANQAIALVYDWTKWDDDDSMGLISLTLKAEECKALVRSPRWNRGPIVSNIRTVHLDPGGGKGRYTVYFLIEGGPKPNRDALVEPYVIVARETGPTVSPYGERHDPRWTETCVNPWLGDRPRAGRGALYYDRAWNCLSEHPSEQRPTTNHRQWFRLIGPAKKLRPLQVRSDLLVGGSVKPVGNQPYTLALFVLTDANVGAVYPFVGLPKRVPFEDESGVPFSGRTTFPANAFDVDVFRLSEAEDGVFAFQKYNSKLNIYSWLPSQRNAFRVTNGGFRRIQSFDVPRFGTSIDWTIAASGFYFGSDTSPGDFVFHRPSASPRLRDNVLFGKKSARDGDIEWTLGTIDRDWDEMYPLKPKRLLTVSRSRAEVGLYEIPSWKLLGTSQIPKGLRVMPSGRRSWDGSNCRGISQYQKIYVDGEWI